MQYSSVKNILNIKTQALGKLGEKLVQNILIDHGCHVADISRVKSGGDIHAHRDNVRRNIEVKTCRLNQRGNYAVTVRGDERSLKNVDYVIVVCVTEIGGFIFYRVPADDITTKRITITPNGKWSKYRVSLCGLFS